MGLFDKIRKGLEKSRDSLGKLVDHAFGRGVLDESAADELEEALIQSDVGPETTEKLIEGIREWMKAAGGGVTRETLREALELRIAELLSAPMAELGAAPPAGEKPTVTLVVGVNGAGKTTTCAKLAAIARSEGKSVILGAADTFRAAAADQLKIWGDRLDIQVVAQDEGADPAAVAFDAVQAGINRGADVVIIDTAGRLHTKVNLMAELEKILRVVAKLGRRVEILLVLDATVGQNGLVQVKSFAGAFPVSGLIVTKLDGTAKAGILIRAVTEFQKPVTFVGVGEGIDDLIPFDPDAFAKNLLK